MAFTKEMADEMGRIAREREKQRMAPKQRMGPFQPIELPGDFISPLSAKEVDKIKDLQNKIAGIIRRKA